MPEFDNDYCNVPKDWDWPPALIKATFDSPWHYAAYVRGLGWIHFCGATKVNAKWVSLTRNPDMEPPTDTELRGFIWERGIEVQVKDIIAIIDAPRGS